MWGFPDASNATGGSDTSRSLVALEVPCPNGSSASVVTVALVDESIGVDPPLHVTTWPPVHEPR
jgi:predicted transporter